MLRAPLLAALLVVAGCQLSPAGRCDSRADCEFGLDCLQGVCAACRGDFDCEPWQGCGDGLCDPDPGRCDVDAHCDSWERCDAGHACVLRADHCANDAACGAAALLQRCDAEHHCTLEPGRCFADADCPAWMASCDTSLKECRFSATGGDDVLALGALGDGRPAVARAVQPTRVEVGFDEGSGAGGHGAVDPRTGELVYRHAGDPGGDTLRRFNPDALTRDPATALMVYPPSPSADDEVAIPTDACPVTWDRWLMQGGTGSLLYACPLPSGALRQLRDRDGVARFPVVSEPLAWSAAGYLLALDAAGALRVYDAGGAGGAIDVTGLPAGAILAQRTSPSGFVVAVRSGAPASDALWEIDEDARSAALVGSYAPLASDYASNPWEVLDADGALYGRAFGGLSEIILKRPLGAAAAVIYDEADGAGANDLAADPFEPFLLLDAGSILITRP
jgi:hypothetical protein